MPVLKSSKKALRVSKRRHGENDLLRKALKTSFKNFRTAPGTKTLAAVYSLIDKAARKNLFHKNKAGRLKSQFSRAVSSK